MLMMVLSKLIMGEESLLYILYKRLGVFMGVGIKIVLKCWLLTPRSPAGSYYCLEIFEALLMCVINPLTVNVIFVTTYAQC